MTPDRLRGRDLEAPFRGVRVPARSLQTTADRCRALAVRMRPDEFFSHATAAELYDLPLPRRLCGGPLHVSTIASRRAVRIAGVVGHAIDPSRASFLRRDGLLVVEPVEVWCQLAAVLTVRELVVLGDALVRREHPIATIEGLGEAVAAARGRRGSRALAEALPLVRERTDSPRETQLRLDILGSGLPEPTVNPAILDTHGRQIAISDLVFLEYKVIVEYDGEQHRTDDLQYARDVERLDDLAQAGYRVIRVTKRHRGPRRQAVLHKIRVALLERGWQPN